MGVKVSIKGIEHRNLFNISVKVASSVAAHESDALRAVMHRVDARHAHAKFPSAECVTLLAEHRIGLVQQRNESDGWAWPSACSVSGVGWCA